MGKLAITKIGMASFHWDEMTLADVYTFIHDMGEPHCNHFNNQHSIDLIQQNRNKVLFKKRYTQYTSSVALTHSIEMNPQGFSWQIDRTIQSDQLIPCRYGITLPLTNPAIEGKEEGGIDMPLVNYQQEWRQDFEGQINIDLPVLKITIANKPAYIALPFTEDVQFFIFGSEQQHFLKISTLNSCDMRLSIVVSFDTSQGFLGFYCKQFPNSQTYVYQFETLSRKIREKFGIRILSHQRVTKKCDAQPPSEEELENYTIILEENLNFYPKEFFKWLGLDLISICGYLQTDERVCGGFLSHDTILFNASSNLSPIFQAKAIHHELFHMIEKKLSSSKSNKLYSLWKTLPTADKFTEHFMGKSLENPVEYRAELFATFVLDPNFVQNIADTDLLVKTKFQIVSSLFTDISENCSEIISTHTRRSENTLTHMQSPPPKLEAKPLVHCEWQLCGIKHSCLTSLGMKGIKISCPQDVPSGNLAYITVNPLDYCSIEYILHKIPIEKSLQTWVDIHTKLEQSNHVLRLRTEDILKADIMTIERFWKGAGISFDVEKIWKIKDELRMVPLDTIPTLKNTWDLFRNSPIIVRVGYGNISFED